MKKIVSIAAILCLGMFLSCANKPAVTGLPSEVKIVKAGGISILPAPRSGVKAVAAAPKDYTYKVVGAFPGYYRILFVNGRDGWIPAGAASKWTVQKGNKVKILLKGGIAVRAVPYDSKSEVLGVAASMYSFDILETSYIYLKIEYPPNKQGWIYAGRPGDMWVEPVGAGQATSAEIGRAHV